MTSTNMYDRGKNFRKLRSIWDNEPGNGKISKILSGVKKSAESHEENELFFPRSQLFLFFDIKSDNQTCLSFENTVLHYMWLAKKIIKEQVMQIFRVMRLERILNMYLRLAIKSLHDMQFLWILAKPLYFMNSSARFHSAFQTGKFFKTFNEIKDLYKMIFFFNIFFITSKYQHSLI